MDIAIDLLCPASFTGRSLTKVPTNDQDKIPFSFVEILAPAASTIGDIMVAVIEGLTDVLPEYVKGQIVHIWMFDPELFP